MKAYQVKRLKNPVDIEVEVPGSKSITNRALFLAALGNGKTVLKGVLFSEDSRYFLSSLQSLGFEVQIDEKQKEVIVEGCNGEIPKKEAEIYVGSAGTAARFLTAMLALSNGTYFIQASKQMKKRPMKSLFDALTDMGAEFEYLEQDGYLPVKVKGSENPGNNVTIDIHKSTQFLSALLMMAPILKNELVIHISSQKKDGAYVRITRRMMEQFGIQTEFDGENYFIKGNRSYQAGTYEIEPDVSAACYFYAMAVLTGGRALVLGVHEDSMQGDKKFLEVLKQLGAVVTDKEQGIEVCRTKDGTYFGIEIDMNDFSDQTMTLAAIMPFAKSKTKITGIGHIRLQESDRLSAIATELTKMGIRVEEGKDSLVIYPGIPQPSEIETYDDHRMAMAFSLIGLKADGITILNPMCCKKTFEEYFDILEQIEKENNVF